MPYWTEVLKSFLLLSFLFSMYCVVTRDIKKIVVALTIYSSLLSAKLILSLIAIYHIIPQSGLGAGVAIVLIFFYFTIPLAFMLNSVLFSMVIIKFTNSFKLIFKIYFMLATFAYTAIIYIWSLNQGTFVNIIGYFLTYMLFSILALLPLVVIIMFILGLLSLKGTGSKNDKVNLILAFIFPIFGSLYVLVSSRLNKETK